MDEIKGLDKKIEAAKKASAELAKINASIAEGIAKIREIPNSPEMQAQLAKLRDAAETGVKIAAETKAIVASMSNFAVPPQNNSVKKDNALPGALFLFTFWDGTFWDGGKNHLLLNTNNIYTRKIILDINLINCSINKKTLFARAFFFIILHTQKKKVIFSSVPKSTKS